MSAVTLVAVSPTVTAMATTVTTEFLPLAVRSSEAAIMPRRIINATVALPMPPITLVLTGMKLLHLLPAAETTITLA